MPSDPQPRDSFYAPPKNVPGLTSNFNPKAVQEAAQNPAPKKKLPTGPFIDAVPAGRYHIPAGMSMETHLKRQAHIHFAKRTVLFLKAARWLQILSRMMQLVSAIGLVVLLISLRGMDTLNAWIMRAPPCVAIIHIVYSIYHNARNARDRAPMSSAGYALFAAASDCCLIPFYVFICLWTWQEREDMLKDPMNDANWVTVFNPANLELNELIVFIVFCTSCAGGGLMVISVLIGLYIAITFRRISKLPPDMNPLDDSTYTSLTTRPSSKRFSKASTTSVDSDTTLKGEMSPKRTVPFLEVRTNNGSLNWEFTKEDGDRFNSKSTLDLPDLVPSVNNTTPLLPPPHKFSEFSDSRRNSVDMSRSHPNSPAHRKNQSMSYYSDHNKENFSEPNTPPRPPRHTYRQRPNDWWTASNLPANLPAVFTGNGQQNARYSTLSQTDTDNMTNSSFGDPRSSRNTFGRTPAHTTGAPGTPTQISSYAGSISTISAPSVASSGPPAPSPNHNNRHSFQPPHMNTPPGVNSSPMGTLGSFATDLAPRPLSFPNSRSNPNSPQHQQRSSISHAVGRIPYARPDGTGSPNSSPTKSFTSPSNGVLGNYARPPPQTSLTPPNMSPPKGGVVGGRKVDAFGDNVYNSPANNSNGVLTPINSAPSSPSKQPLNLPSIPGTPSSVRDKKKKYEHLAQNSPGRSTSGEKRKSRVKREEKERRKSMKHHDAEERDKEASTRVVSNSGADFGHMFGNPTSGVRGRVISGSQVV
ncbi:hypothetical protein ABW19_dt0204993 [Dactylella cylindrospora]|nr:hypothetical protein ABW19_dt0204993 [Dactylella cylindrospora]